MTTYYVDPVAGDNGDDGLTSGNAWATLAFTNANIAAGDTVNMMDGHFAENLSATTTGTAGNIITWQAVNARLVSIQAQIISSGEAYQAFDGIKYLGDGVNDAWIRGSGNSTLKNITWDNFEIFAANRHAIDIEPSGSATSIGSYPDTLVFQNGLMDQCHGCFNVWAQNSSLLTCDLRDMRDQSGGVDIDYIRFFGRDNLIKGNWCHGTDVANTGASHVDVVQIFDGGNARIVDGLVIEENFFEVVIQGIFMTHKNTADIIDDITIQNNIFIEPTSGATPSDKQVAMMTFYGITNIDVNHNTLIGRRDTKCTIFRFHGSKSIGGVSGGRLTSGSCRDNIVVRGGPNSSIYPAGIANVTILGNISKNLNGLATDFNSGVPIDPQLIDFAGDGYDAQGTFLDADATWRPVISTSRSLNAASDGGDLGAEIAVDGAGPPTDTEPPVISLIGNSTIQIPDTDATYTDAGATCSDNFDGELVMTAGVHDTDGVTANLGTPGTYTYDWDRDDAAANSAVQVTRTVIITATDPADVLEITIRLAV